VRTEKLVMPDHVNSLGQPIGKPLPNWRVPSAPPREVMTGQYCRLEPIDPARHADGLFRANALDQDGRTWTYLPYGPFDSLDAYREWMIAECMGDDPLFFAIIDETDGQPKGLASYLRIAPAIGTIEVGHLHFSPALKQTAAATEAMYLLMQRAFDLGYRRYEWKCDSLNAPSRSAAQRLGFAYEGTFRQATVYKRRSRDTAWYSVIDQDWPALREAFLNWLKPSNFDDQGRQRSRLQDFVQRSTTGLELTGM
jgi:RimJ/RimL family protein N-acetyltransferase